MSEGIVYTEFKGDWESLYVQRYNRHIDELKWLYMELYSNESMLSELCYQIHNFFIERDEGLKNRDVTRENNPDWYRKSKMTGMALYIDHFADTIKGVEQSIEHLQKCNINYVHFMPFFETTRYRTDDQYAITDFRKTMEKIGKIEDLCHLTKLCHEKSINVSVDFIMNRTSNEHEWAKKAMHGDVEYMNRYVTKTDHSYEWDLNYKNPRVLNEMMYNYMFIANLGTDLIQINEIEDIWKGESQNCSKVSQIHTIARIMRIISEIVCPGVLLLGNVKNDMKNAITYFGEDEKPEFHMVYQKTFMNEVWNSVATRNVKLLQTKLDVINKYPKEYVFVNYLRNHEKLNWNLDYDFLYKNQKINQKMHREYLNEYFLGRTGYSNSRGEVENNSDNSEKICFCGTTASMCGLEKAIDENNKKEINQAIKLEIMLYAYLFIQSGIPVIYSGDEIGQMNDYSYKENRDKMRDIQNVCRGKFDWSKAVKVVDEYSIEGKIMRGLNKIQVVKNRENTFCQIADVRVVDTKNNSVICIAREFAGEKILGIFNFSEHEKIVNIDEEEGIYEDLLSGKKMKVKCLQMQGYDFYYLKKIVVY